jgi:2-polyprenyl-3-methyl-5-hydroxy-6-metoxy-1,4-benzoquinol methylase
MKVVSIERFDDTGAVGFVRRQGNDETMTLRLVRGREVISEAKADLFRPDVVTSGQSSHPYCGFVLPIPLDKASGSHPDIVLSSGEVVAHGSKEQKKAENEFGLSAAEVRSVCDHPFFGINGWGVQGGILSISGVLLPPNGRFEDLECIGQPGVSFSFKWPIYSPNSDSFYWYFPGAPYIGFRLDVDLAASVSEESSFEFYFKVKGEKESRGRLRNISVPKDLRFFQTLPGDFNVKRVQNLQSTVGATIAGYSDFKRIALLASQYITLGTGSTVLDWGCGFGRVCRFFNKEFGCKTIGVELDELNLEWMRSHLKYITPLKTTLDAKIDVPDGSVDLIYGISVMTHIREEQQQAWLEELCRILAPNGILLLTTAGAGSFAFSSRWMQRDHLNDWRAKGFVEIEQASIFDRDIGGGG